MTTAKPMGMAAYHDNGETDGDGSVAVAILRELVDSGAEHGEHERERRRYLDGHGLHGRDLVARARRFFFSHGIAERSTPTESAKRLHQAEGA